MRFKKLPEGPPTARDLAFQPYQFYDEKFHRPVNTYYQQEVDGRERDINDRSLYPRTEWKLRGRIKKFKAILSGSKGEVNV